MPPDPAVDAVSELDQASLQLVHGLRFIKAGSQKRVNRPTLLRAACALESDALRTRTHAHDLSVFQGLPSDVLAQLHDDLEHRTYPAGAIIVCEGDRTNEIYIAQSGSAEVVIADLDGTEHRVGSVVPGARSEKSRS